MIDEKKLKEEVEKYANSFAITSDFTGGAWRRKYINDFLKIIEKQEQVVDASVMHSIYLRDNCGGYIHKYGENPHDSLVMSEDGKYLYYGNLQNGAGTMFREEGYSFVTKDGKTLDEIKDRNPYDHGEKYVNIGGF